MRESPHIACELCSSARLICINNLARLTFEKSSAPKSVSYSVALIKFSRDPLPP